MAREHDARDHQPGAGLSNQCENGNVVEVVAHLADNLRHPGVTVVGVLLRRAARVVILVSDKVAMGAFNDSNGLL
jgi:hypothetical protein